MAHFNIGTQEQRDSSTLVAALSADFENVSQTGGTNPLRTSASQNPTASLTSYSISEMMQGAATYRSPGYAYDAFNQSLSSDLGNIIRTEGGQNQLLAGRQALLAQDVLTNEGFNDGIFTADSGGVISGGAVPTTTNAGEGTTTSPPSSRFPPGTFPQGPFPLMIIRTSNSSSITPTADPVEVDGNVILDLLEAVGFTDVNAMMTMWGFAFRESHHICNAAGINDNGTLDVGLWQINSVHWSQGAPGMGRQAWTVEEWIDFPAAMQATDPLTNAEHMWRVSSGGTNVNPWNSSLSNAAEGQAQAREFFRANGYDV